MDTEMTIFDGLKATTIERNYPCSVWSECYIECVNGKWGIYWPDCTKAWEQTFKTQGWATRTLNWLKKDDLAQQEKVLKNVTT